MKNAVCPLYKGFVLPAQSEIKNKGLLFDKFFFHWIKDGVTWKLGKGKNKFLKGITGTVGDPKMISAFVTRIQTLVEALGGAIFFFKNTDRFVTGTGLSNPVEIGFAWHPTLGTPYLPGSSIKGLVRAWAQNSSEIDQAIIDQIFGKKTEKNEGQSGSIIFFDAVPVRPPHLTVDVMTPHYTDYYTKQEPPGDWHTPKPIPFLTVDSGQTFMFAIAPLTQAHNNLVPYAGDYLAKALDELGAGAKTSAGYGRFVVDEQETGRYLASRGLQGWKQ